MTNRKKQTASNGAQVMIELCGRNDGGERTEFRTEGLLVDHGEQTALIYQEIDPDTLTATQVMIRLENEGITVLRGGDPVTAMVFRLGRTCESEYRAAGQSLMLRTFPIEISVKRRGLRGHVRIVYQATLGMLGGVAADTGVRTLDLRFRPLFTEEKSAPAREKNRALRGENNGADASGGTHALPEKKRRPAGKRCEGV